MYNGIVPSSTPFLSWQVGEGSIDAYHGVARSPDRERIPAAPDHGWAVSSTVEQLTLNQLVESSNLSRPTIKSKTYVSRLIAGFFVSGWCPALVPVSFSFPSDQLGVGLSARESARCTAPCAFGGAVGLAFGLACRLSGGFCEAFMATAAILKSGASCATFCLRLQSLPNLFPPLHMLGVLSGGQLLARACGDHAFLISSQIETLSPCPRVRGGLYR